jgi:predicted Holliday junction resolvase-like endonuclease
MFAKIKSYAIAILTFLVGILFFWVKKQSKKIDELKTEVDIKDFEATKRYEEGKNAQDAENINKEIENFNKEGTNEKADNDDYTTVTI